MFCILLITSITALILINADKIFEYEGVEISGLSDLEPSSEDILEFHKFLEYANNSAYDHIPIFGYYPELIQNPIITEFKRGGICPYIIPVPPLKKCWVYWDYCVRANLGNRHRRWYTAFKAPRVTWRGEENALYTLIMHNPDVPIGNFSYRRWRPWVVGNIPGPCRVSDGFVLYDYNLDYKPIEAFQRHIFLVYKQKKSIFFDHKDVYKPRTLQRFNLTKFIYKYKLGNPQYGNFYYSFLK